MEGHVSRLRMCLFGIGDLAGVVASAMREDALAIHSDRSRDFSGSCYREVNTPGDCFGNH